MGRKKIVCSLGKKKVCSFWLYPIEEERMKIEFNKIKRERVKYQTKVD